LQNAADRLAASAQIGLASDVQRPIGEKTLGFHVVSDNMIEFGAGKSSNAARQSFPDTISTCKGRTMANQMPKSADYTNLSRKVLQYSEEFLRVVNKMKQPGFSEADWAPLEEIVDVKNFERVGVFLTERVEVSNWQQYKQFISRYGGNTSWEGTLRRITEVPGLVFLELEERNTRDGVTDVANTVTIYKFNTAGKLRNLDVYVAHVGRR
jgi:hypothetical protein